MSESLPDNPIESEFEKLKIGTEPKPTEFYDLDDDAIGMIIDKLELKERLVLGKVSRGLRSLVARKKSILKSVHFNCNTDYVCVWYDDIKVVYADSKCDPKLITLLSYEKATFVETGDHVKLALADLQIFLGNPTVQLNSLNVDYYPRNATDGKSIHSDIENFFDRLKNLLKSLNHKISVHTFVIRSDSSHHIMAILPYLKPGTLEVIEFEKAIGSDEEVDQIVNLEQWKQAKEISFRYKNNMWPEEHFMHFKKISVSGETMDLKGILKLRDLFAMSPNFEICIISAKEQFVPRNIQHDLGDVISTVYKYRDRDPMYTIHHPMTTDSNQIIEIKVWPDTATIWFTKIARPSG